MKLFFFVILTLCLWQLGKAQLNANHGIRFMDIFKPKPTTTARFIYQATTRTTRQTTTRYFRRWSPVWWRKVETIRPPSTFPTQLNIPSQSTQPRFKSTTQSPSSASYGSTSNTFPTSQASFRLSQNTQNPSNILSPTQASSLVTRASTTNFIPQTRASTRLSLSASKSMNIVFPTQAAGLVTRTSTISFMPQTSASIQSSSSMSKSINTVSPTQAVSLVTQTSTISQIQASTRSKWSESSSMILIPPTQSPSTTQASSIPQTLASTRLINMVPSTPATNLQTRSSTIPQTQASTRLSSSVKKAIHFPPSTLLPDTRNQLTINPHTHALTSQSSTVRSFKEQASTRTPTWMSNLQTFRATPANLPTLENKADSKHSKTFFIKTRAKLTPRPKFFRKFQKPAFPRSFDFSTLATFELEPKKATTATTTATIKTTTKSKTNVSVQTEASDVRLYKILRANFIPISFFAGVFLTSLSLIIFFSARRQYKSRIITPINNDQTLNRSRISNYDEEGYLQPQKTNVILNTSFVDSHYS